MIVWKMGVQPQCLTVCQFAVATLLLLSCVRRSLGGFGDALATGTALVIGVIGTDEDDLFGAQLGYIPTTSKCIANTSIVNHEAAFQPELEWVEGRDKKTAEAWKAYLQQLGFEGLSVDEEALSAPRLAFVCSGGGLRAALTGAGVLQAMDARDPEASDRRSGGLLQMATYAVGLSGGTWPINSLHDNGSPPVAEWVTNLTAGLEEGLTKPGKDFGEQQRNLGVFTEEVDAKEEAGYETSLVDLWGRVISYQFFPGNQYGANTTYHGLRDRPHFKDHGLPAPITVSLLLFDQDAKLAEEGVHFEINAWSSGVADRGMDWWLPTQVLGTQYESGSVADPEACVYGFDNLGWVTGSSSAVFAQVQDSDLGEKAMLDNLVDESMANMANPVKGLAPNTSQDEVVLADGGLGTFATMPLYPVLMPARGVDVIIAVDAANNIDATKFPDGRSLVQAVQHAKDNGLPVPEVPDQSYFDSNQGRLLSNVTFFGCDDDSGAPAIVYLPNRNVTYNSGQSTFKLEYGPDEVSGMVGNGFELLAGEGLPRCVGCLLLKRGGSAYTSSDGFKKGCEACLEGYCFKPEEKE